MIPPNGERSPHPQQKSATQDVFLMGTLAVMPASPLMLEPTKFEQFSEFDCCTLEALRLCRFQQEAGKNIRKSILHVDPNNSLQIVSLTQEISDSLIKELETGTLAMQAYLILGILEIAIWLNNCQIYSINLFAALELSNSDINSEGIPMVEVLERGNEFAVTETANLDAAAGAVVQDYLARPLDTKAALNRALDEYFPESKIREEMEKDLPSLIEERVNKVAQEVVAYRGESALPAPMNGTGMGTVATKKETESSDGDFIKQAERRLKKNFKPDSLARYRTHLLNAIKAIAPAKSGPEQWIGYLKEMRSPTEQGQGQALLELIVAQFKGEKQKTAREKIPAEIPGLIQALESKLLVAGQ